MNVNFTLTYNIYATRYSVNKHAVKKEKIITHFRCMLFVERSSSEVMVRF